MTIQNPKFQLGLFAPAGVKIYRRSYGYVEKFCLGRNKNTYLDSLGFQNVMGKIEK